MSNDKSGNPGNFANDRGKASEAGQKGGQHSQGSGSDMHKQSSQGTGKTGQQSGSTSESSHKGGGHSGGSHER